MDNMNFNQNDNFYGPLFSNNNLESSLTNENMLQNENDLPPELGEIKNLSDATVIQAPTMDALGPANFITENQTLVNDPLDLYEKQGFLENEFSSQSIEQNNPRIMNQIFNNDFTNSSSDENNVSQNNFSSLNSENEITDNVSGNYDSFESSNIKNNFSIPENKEVETNDFEIINKTLEQNSSNNNFINSSFNENNASQNNFSSLNSENEINDDISGNYDSFESTNIENSFNILENKEVETNDFEIVNKSLTQDTFKEKELLDKDTNSIELTNAEDIIDSSEVENITDVSSLGLDEVYTEPDSLEIIDAELFDEQDDIDEPIVQIDKENDTEEIKSIKKLVEELKEKGKNIKIEEFDFENMHQLIIIMEK